jgi:hypothetical protein
MHGLLEALFSDEARLGTARLAGTEERVAVVVDVEFMKWGTRLTTTLAMLRPAEEPFVDPEGAPTPAATAAFEALRTGALDTSHETWFDVDSQGRVHVCFAKRGTPVDPSSALVTLPWQDPDELFELMMIYDQS